MGQQRLRKELEGLHPDEALALEPSDIQRWIRGHDQLALPPVPADGSALRFRPSPALLAAERPSIMVSPPPLLVESGSNELDAAVRSVGRGRKSGIKNELRHWELS